jgi:hypothetical protein
MNEGVVRVLPGGVPPTGKPRETNGEHKGAAVEQLLDERLHAEQLQARDTGDEEVDSRDRPDRIESSGHDRRRAEERGSEGRQQKAQPGGGVGGAERACVQDARESADQA